MEKEKVEQQQEEKVLVRKIYYRKDNVWGLEMQVYTWDLNGNKHIDWYPLGQSDGVSFIKTVWRNQKQLRKFLKDKPLVIIDNVIIIKE